MKSNTLRLRHFEFDSLPPQLPYRIYHLGRLQGNKVKSNCLLSLKKKLSTTKPKRTLPAEVLGGFLRNRPHLGVISSTRFTRPTTAKPTVKVAENSRRDRGLLTKHSDIKLPNREYYVPNIKPIDPPRKIIREIENTQNNQKESICQSEDEKRSQQEWSSDDDDFINPRYW